jgi:chromosome transmission fidelity protein 1
MIRQLGLALLNICSVVPDGVVVFFPSYGYLDEVVASWQTPDNPASQGAPGTAGPATAAPTIWDRLAAKKALFRETKGGSSEDILQQYSAAILSPEPTSGPAQQQPPTSQKPKTGAVLLSVVGGKLSEGINFADRLGRCVIVVGLPYPNIHAPDWKARLEYVEATALSRLRDHTHTNTRAERPVQDQDQDQGQNPLPTPTREDREQAKQAAREFYENACMRAVNQSIGRVIRHRGDYAAVVLVDRRFGAERVRAKLPGWIRAGLPSAGEEARGLVGLMGGLVRFFRGRE